MHYNIVKKASRAYLEEMNNRRHEQPDVFNCINLLQRTPFKVNEKSPPGCQEYLGKRINRW